MDVRYEMVKNAYLIKLSKNVFFQIYFQSVSTNPNRGRDREAYFLLFTKEVKDLMDGFYFSSKSFKYSP